MPLLEKEGSRKMIEMLLKPKESKGIRDVSTREPRERGGLGNKFKAVPANKNFPHCHWS